MARDTADDWEKIGATEPWYGVLSAPEFLSQNLTEEGKNAFYAQGAAEMALVANLLREKFPPFAPKIGVDFGSGLGRLAFPMAQMCDHVVGLDVSPSMRKEASVQAKIRKVGNIAFHAAIPDGLRVDWINSYIVFQHILPRTGYYLLRNLLSSLAIGGHVSIQITYAHDKRGLADVDRDIHAWRFDGETLTVLENQDYEQGRMSMYDYDLNRVFRVFTSAGIGDMHIRNTDHGGVHGFWIFGRRDT